MNPFDLAAVLVLLAASFGYVNYRLLRLPAAIGVMALTLAAAGAVSAVDALAPGWHLREQVAAGCAGIDFHTLLMRGMLGLLLFAGALHVGVEELHANSLEVGALATAGVALSTAFVGGVGWLLLRALGLPVPLRLCLVFGALISPTDPIAVMGLVKRVRLSRNLETTIAGESLFNDGVGVVVFVALASWAGLSGEGGPMPFAQAAEVLVKQVAGGMVLGGAAGYVAYRVLKTVDERELELLITLALALATYAVAFPLGVSGPIAVVVAGLLIGNRGRRYAMSLRTIEHVDAFWGMTDEILNAVLFLLMGMEVFVARLSGLTVLAAGGMALVVLAARWFSVAAPLLVLRRDGHYPPGAVTLLTWGGLRGGLSLAMALSLPSSRWTGLIQGCTYGVVVFSVLVQGLTMGPLLRWHERRHGAKS